MSKQPKAAANPGRPFGGETAAAKGREGVDALAKPAGGAERMASESKAAQPFGAAEAPREAKRGEHDRLAHPGRRPHAHEAADRSVRPLSPDDILRR